jgi:hypothetical protein
MVAFAARSMAGRQAARSGLMQVLVAQAALVVLAFFLTRDVERAETDLQSTVFTAQLRETAQDPQMVEQVLPFYTHVLAAKPAIWLVVRTTATALILIALTRLRARAFFEAAEARWSSLDRR